MGQLFVSLPRLVTILGVVFCLSTRAGSDFVDQIIDAEEELFTAHQELLNELAQHEERRRAQELAEMNYEAMEDIVIRAADQLLFFEEEVLATGKLTEEHLVELTERDRVLTGGLAVFGGVVTLGMLVRASRAVSGRHEKAWITRFLGGARRSTAITLASWLPALFVWDRSKRLQMSRENLEEAMALQFQNGLGTFRQVCRAIDILYRYNSKIPIDHKLQLTKISDEKYAELRNGFCQDVYTISAYRQRIRQLREAGYGKEELLKQLEVNLSWPGTGLLSLLF